ncbi:Bug family tripartite tricarboxylate transporter substrate binding protein [Paracraurococcus lichenis]|uniref:Tripartite tricarboxylate transporter substrate binding protein n=1 Tax=Paracraurococcus lichenis TaxID=3064888 RepID=A0ABT9E1X1_9PROT|nr:tripartite tricarboxylate transporter substrate binding protein [Paracraurococcus sp. LOR1-02]MDO9710162.1 tripartite tricarboxylate transporter substrate binding protein [Paracraurococcus sp. LOR1-02]
MAAVTRRAALAAPALLLAPRARAQSWRPGQQVRIIVPAAAGGTTDIMGRLCAQYLQARWGTPVVVENRTGAGGTIGTLEAVRARPDGTTLLSGNVGPQAIAYTLFRNLPYAPQQLTPIAGQIRGPNVLVVNADSPVRDMAGFAAWLRANPGKVSYASTGVGQSTHLTPVWMLQLLGVEAIHVAFRGSAPAQIELIAGNVGFLFDNLTGVIEHIRAGRLRALCVSSAERNAELPEVPAARETLPELARFEVNTWFGLFGPAGLPPAVVRSVNAEINAMLDLPETAQRFAQLGGVPLKLSPEGFADWVGAETRKWGEVIRKEGLQLDAS